MPDQFPAASPPQELLLPGLCHRLIESRLKGVEDMFYGTCVGRLGAMWHGFVKKTKKSRRTNGGLPKAG
jgi:hypothetical protein